MTVCNKPVRRRIGDLAVTLYPNGLIGFRPSRTRKEHTLPIGRAFRIACELTIESERQAKLKTRNAMRAARGLDPLPVRVKRSLI